MDAKPEFKTNTSNKTITVTLSKTFYEKAAIFQSAYRFTDRCHVDIKPGEGDTVAVSFTLKEDHMGDVDHLIKEFNNEVIDQQLRLDLEKRYGRLRELIYEHAFSPISNLDERMKDVR